ncbi:MAG: hypothetical protein KA257_15185, partial [Opitutaceae bacterium]|nr:hypothetical protein [Opitutaceae bacterium]
VRWGFGEAIGGLVVLAIITNLPEIAITASGALRGELEVAVGNLLGGIAIQTVVLVLLDVLRPGLPLLSRASSPALKIEAIMVIAVLAVVIIGARLPASLQVGHVSPAEVLIVLLWIGGLVWVGRLRRSPSHKAKVAGHPHGHARRQKASAAPHKTHCTAWLVMVLIVGAAVTLAGGVVLEGSGKALANHWGMSGVIFGATVLALATSLPEISTGWAAIRLGDDCMAVSDIFGGNAFLPVLFLFASVLSGGAVLPQAKATDLYLAALGILLTAVYLAGLMLKSPRRIAGMGVDSLAVLLLYGAGVLGMLVL